MKPFDSSLPKDAPEGPSRRVVYVPVPHPFHFGFKERRPLVPMPAVKTLLKKNSREVMALIEEGRLRWAFDIRSGKAGQREVRVLWQSLLEFSKLYPQPASPNASEETEFEAVISLILPRGIVVPQTKPGVAEMDYQKRPLPVLTVAQVAQAFACLGQHVLNLLREQSIQAVNQRQGPSRLIARASAVKFLKERRIS